MTTPTIAKRPVGRPRKKPIACTSESSACNATECVCPFSHPVDPVKTAKWAVECPNRAYVICVEWTKPGQLQPWRNTFLLKQLHLYAEFGADIHAGKVGVRVLSVPRNSPQYAMAVSNDNVFVKNLKAAQAKEQTSAAQTLAALPSSSTGPTGT